MLVKAIIIFFCLFESIVKGSESELCIRPVCIPSDYNKLDLPRSNKPNTIHVWFPYVEIKRVDEGSGTITLTLKMATK